MNIFITGTDTGVGKTWIASLLVRNLRAAGADAVGFKPICCGGREDAELLTEASGGGVEINDVNPVWLRPPVAPFTASMMEGRAVDLALIRRKFSELCSAHKTVIVEGAGGWLVPVTRDFSMADLAKEFAMPVLVVAANRLGVINHALLTVEAIRSRGLKCAGVILNEACAPEPGDPAVVTNAAILSELLAALPGESVPLLGEVPFGADTLPTAMLKVAV